MPRHNDNSLHKTRLFRTHHRRHYLACALSAVIIGLTAPTAGAQSQTADISIESQILENALIVFSTQTGVGIFARGDQVRHIRVQPVSGTMPVEEALKRMLEGTGLVYELNDDGTYVVMPAPEIDPREVRRRNVGVEEVYVTARKREESVQDVPISITAFSAADLKAAGIRSLADMEGVVPGLNMGGGGNGVKKDSNPYIRGVGQRETKVTLDPAVGTYIDGIYIARTAGAMLDTVGVERIEVLRGPQGTLFGKNTTGGAISITTTKPHETFGGSVGVNVGNYGRSDATAMLNIPILENKLFGRLSVSSKNSEGTFTNVVDNVKWNNDNRITAIGQLRWLPTENVTADLLVERTRIRERPRPQKCQYLREPGFMTLQLVYMGGGPFNTTYEDACKESSDLPDDKFSSDMSDSSGSPLEEARYWVDTTTVGGTVTWDIGDIGFVSDLSMKSISAWRKTETIADEDLDAVGGTVVPFGMTGGDRTFTPIWLMRAQPEFTETTQFSQEFQFSGRALNDRLFFSTGLYYFEEETPQDDLILSAGFAQQEFDTLQTPPFQNYSYLYHTMGLEASYERLETDNKAYAWFGQVDFDITSQLQLTAGLRYTREERFSRYSKGGLHLPSIFSDIVATGSVQALGASYAYHNTPGFNPIDQWVYSSCVSPSGNTACLSTAEANDPANFVPGLLVGDEATHRSDAWTPMVSLKYNFSDELLSRLNMQNTMLYATYSEGYHSGGVTAGAADQNRNGTADPVEFDPETVKNYEIGLKTTAFDRRLQANIAAFYMDYTDMQITSAAERGGIPVPFIENVGKSAIQGVEAEIVAFPTANWRIMLSASYTEAEFKEWDAVYHRLDLAGAIAESAIVDRSDEPMPRVPKWQAFLMTDYTIPFADGSTLTPSISFRYMSEIYQGFDRGSYCYTTGGICERSPFIVNQVPQDIEIELAPGAKDALLSEPTVMVDARISWLSSDQRMEIALWGKNLTNETDYLVGGIALPDLNGGTGRIYADPRTFGLEMTYRFGGE